MVWVEHGNRFVSSTAGSPRVLPEHWAGGSFAQMRRRRGCLSALALINALRSRWPGTPRPANSVQFMRWRTFCCCPERMPVVRFRASWPVGVRPAAFFLVNTDVPTRNPTLAASNPSLRRTNRRLSNAHSKRAQFRRCVRASTKCRLEYGHNFVCAIPMPSRAAQPLVLCPADIEGRCGSVCDNKRWPEKTNANRDGLSRIWPDDAECVPCQPKVQ